MSNIFELILVPSFGFVVLRMTTPILFAAIGNSISDRGGVSNIGMEGTMLIAAFVGVWFSALTQNAWLGFIAAIIVSGLFSALLAYLTLYLGTQVIMGGIALNLFASSFTIFLLYLVTGQKGSSAALASKALPTIHIPIIQDIPVVGEIFSGHNILVYVSLLLIFCGWVVLNKTKFGMRVRAVGENPEAAAAVGINVRKTQFMALCLSGILAGMGGAYMSMGYLTIFTRDMIAGRGWIAIAASAMGKSRIGPTTLTAFLFGIFGAIGNVLQLHGYPAELISTLPYVAVFVGLVSYSVSQYYRGKRI